MGRIIALWLAASLGVQAQPDGFVKANDGKPIAAAIVQIIGGRNPGKSPHRADWDSADLEDPSVGIKTVTQSDGSFALPSLPTNRLYHLGIFAPGRTPFVYWGLDPRTNGLIIKQPKPWPRGTQKYLIHGRVVNQKGEPIAGALVWRDGVGIDGGHGWGWQNDGWHNDQITDTNGEFYFGRDKRFTQVQVRVRARHSADAMEWLAPTNALQVISLAPGITLRGRVVKAGKPLSNMRIEVTGADRNSEVFAGHFEARTGPDGVFEFPHLSTNTGWYVYGIISSLKSYGLLAPRLIGPPPGMPGTTGAPHWTNLGPVDLGDLPVKPGLRLAGHLRTSDGQPLPPKIKLNLGVNTMWGGDSATVQQDGAFEFTALPPDIITIYLGDDKWRWSRANRSLDIWNPCLTGTLDNDKTNLVLEIQQGRWQSSYDSTGQLPQQDWPRNRPFEGAEDSGSPPICIKGTVVDADTGQPVPLFQTIPGYKPPHVTAFTPPETKLQKLLDPFKKKPEPWNEIPFWQPSRAELASNGIFSITFLTLSSRPMFRIEAEGYEPFESEPITNDVRAFAIRLKRGLGPRGIVLLPNGDPAAGATVIYAVKHEMFNLDTNQLRVNGSPELEKQVLVRTGKDGRFSFAPRPDGCAIIGRHPQGWIEQHITKPGEDFKLRLEPWATVVGTLINANGSPAADVEVAVGMPRDFTQSDDPYFFVNYRCITDKAGHFHFDSVPPGTWHIDRIVHMANNSWLNIEQTWFVADPGVTNDLGKVTYDKPPPPPLAEQIKQKLGF